MAIDHKNTKISAVSDFLESRGIKGQKEEIDKVLGNHKSVRDHLVSTFLFTLNELQQRMLIVCRFQNKTTYFLAKKLPTFLF